MPASVTERTDLVASASHVIDRGVLPTNEVIARVHRIQEVMKALMKDGVHYGKIPGTPKPTLYKPGAELLLMTFRIAASPCLIEDLSTPDEIRYRVTVRGTNQVSGEVVGEMSGECSSNEEKYRWRKPVCKEEFEDTPHDRRREKWQRGNDGAYKLQQVRTSPADVANTILKMAIKRALIAMTLVALGASDIFSQDLEDLSAELRESLGGHEEEQPRERKQAPQRKSETQKASGKTEAPRPQALTVVGKVERLWQPKGKEYYAVKIAGDDRLFTFWKKGNEQLHTDIRQFEGTDHQVKLSYTETKKDDKTFQNAVGVAIADAEPAQTAAPEKTEPADPAEPLTADDIFGGGDREPGAEG